MRSFPQARNAVRRFISKMPNYNQVNVGYSLLPKSLFKEKNMYPKTNEQKTLIQSQIIHR